MNGEKKKILQRKRIELHCHTKSGGNATMYPGELIRYASKMYMPAIAVTDTAHIFAFPELQSVCRREEYITRPIYGIEVLVRYGDDKVYTLTALIKNETGKENIYELMSTVRCGDTRPVFDYDSFIKYREGLLIGSGAENGKLRIAARKNASDESLNSIIDELDYIEVLPFECDEEINKRLIQLAEKKGKIVVAISDAHFLTESDRVPWKVINKMLFDSFNKHGVHLLSTGEMLDAFSYLPEDKATEIVIDNTYKIAEQCEEINIAPGRVKDPEVKDAPDRLRDMCYKALDSYYGDDDKAKALEWLNKELSILENNKECSFPLEIKELIDKAGLKACDLSMRGLYAGSMVLYLLGISGVDPVKNGLPPELVYGINLSGSLWIELNVPSSFYEKVRGLVGTLEGVGKALTDTWHESFFTDFVEDLVIDSGIEEIIDYNEDETKKICEKITGNVSEWKINPSSIWMLPEGVDCKKLLPICKTVDGTETAYFCHFIWPTVRTMGLVKHDKLEVLRQLSSLTGIDLSDVPTDFDNVKELFKPDENGEVTACKDIPGFKSDYIRKMIAKVKPETFDDMVRIQGLCHGTNVWIDNGEKIIDEYGFGLRDIIANREDIYDYLLSKGLDSNEAFDIKEYVRKGNPRTKRTLWLKWKKDMFLAGVPSWYIESCEKIRYLFPRAHSASYALMQMRLAWFKLNYPKEFRTVVEELGL